MSSMRLLGEDSGNVFITDTNGVKLWEVRMTGVDVSERVDDVPSISITAIGVPSDQ
jgi:hypothetical protein